MSDPLTTLGAKRLEAASGAFFGACIGDAAGATLEFIGRKPRADEVERALTMPGGGVLKVAPGQITDDCELALCLAQALAGRSEFDIERVAEKYSRWVDSAPFDIGNTTQMSLGCKIDPNIGSAESMRQAAAQSCVNSKANGALMRIVPLGIWAAGLSADEIAKFARKDSCLSHPNESTADASAAYSIALAHLVTIPGDQKGAFDAAVSWANKNANLEVNSWLTAAAENLDVPYHPQVGFVKIAFVHAFRHLNLQTSFLDALKETLAGGGDTDTNACIVGGLIGAAHGGSNLPADMVKSVLDCDTSLGRPRPEFLSASQVPELVERLLHKD